MAINIAHRCQFPQDLEAATDALNQDLSDRMLANQDLLSDAVAASEGIAELINEGNDLLSQILNNNTPPAETRPTTEKEKLSRPESKDELLVGLGILVITVFFIGGVVGWLLHLAIM